MSSLVAASLAGLALAGGTHRDSLPTGFHQIASGPDGGTVVQGWIPNRVVPRFFRATVIYLPPGYDPARRYPVVYLLQGFPGSPYQYVDGIDLPSYADPRIAGRSLPPFIAVIPPAGIDAHHGDWTGVWEQYLVSDVVPWADANLPTIPHRAGRVLAGLSAGGYGAVDIGLRHPLLFSTLEAWSGYFHPLRAGALVHARPAGMRAQRPESAGPPRGSPAPASAHPHLPLVWNHPRPGDRRRDEDVLGGAPRAAPTAPALARRGWP